MRPAAVYGGAMIRRSRALPDRITHPPPALHSATIPSPPNRSQNAHLAPPASGVWGPARIRGGMAVLGFRTRLARVLPGT
jgi:hypothetical protein